MLLSGEFLMKLHEKVIYSELSYLDPSVKKLNWPISDIYNNFTNKPKPTRESQLLDICGEYPVDAVARTIISKFLKLFMHI